MALRNPTCEPTPSARVAGLRRRRADRQPVARGRVAQLHRQRAQPPDARAGGAAGPATAGAQVARRWVDAGRAAAAGADRAAPELGRATGRERGGQYGELAVVAV